MKRKTIRKDKEICEYATKHSRYSEVRVAGHYCYSECKYYGGELEKDVHSFNKGDHYWIIECNNPEYIKNFLYVAINSTYSGMI